MPQITYRGPRYALRRPDTPDEFIRGNMVEVSQEWLNKYRKYITIQNNFTVVGDEGVTVDFGNDGIPDSGWTKKAISGWLKAKDVTVGGYATKGKLLDLVSTTLYPPAPEPEVIPEPEVVEEVAIEVVEELEKGDEQ
mgnify:CR=1 FL=1